MSNLTFDWTETSDAAEYELGAGLVDVHNQNKTYKYVKFNNGAGNVAAVAGNIAYYKDDDGYEVTSDLSDAAASQSAGVFLSAMTDAYYGWIQTKGVGTINHHNSSAADGDFIIPHASTDGAGDIMAAGDEHEVVAVALAAAGTASPYAQTCRLSFR